MDGYISYYKNITDYHQSKLYEKELTTYNTFLYIIDTNTVYLENNHIDTTKIEDDQIFKNILEKVSKYKLKKKKGGENAPIHNYDNEIFTKEMERLTKIIMETISMTVYSMLKTGHLYFQNGNFNEGNIFFIPKDKRKMMTPQNSRCLINCDNRLKVLTRYIRDEYITPIFDANRVDTEIHQVKKCVIKYIVKKKTKLKLCFESIANIANIIHTTPYKYLLLDLTNAFNNVTYAFMYKILTEYLVVPEDITERENLSRGIVRLLSEMKYYCRQTKEYVKRNKGVPQGSSVSIDLFVLCMDYIVKHIIRELKNTLDLEYNTDYELVVYVDDILILIKTNKFEQNITQIIDVFVNVFQEYHFQLNGKKSKKSQGLPNCEFDEVKPTDKYLGLYFETDVNKYLTIIEKEIRKRLGNNSKFHNMKIIDQNLKDNKFNVRQTMCIRGKLQYRMRPFAKNIEERNKLFHKLGYPNIADTLFKIE